MSIPEVRRPCHLAGSVHPGHCPYSRFAFAALSFETSRAVPTRSSCCPPSPAFWYGGAAKPTVRVRCGSVRAIPQSCCCHPEATPQSLGRRETGARSHSYSYSGFASSPVYLPPPTLPPPHRHEGPTFALVYLVPYWVQTTAPMTAQTGVQMKRQLNCRTKSPNTLGTMA